MAARRVVQTARPPRRRAVPHRTRRRPLWLIYLLGWLVPGGGHLWLGRTAKGARLPGDAAADVRRSAWPSRGGCFRSSPASRSWRWRPSPTSASGLPYFIAQALGFGAGRARGRHLRVRQRVPHHRRAAQRAGHHRRPRHRAGAQVERHEHQSHLLLMVLFAACVAVVGGVLLKDTPARAGPHRRPRSSAACVGAALVLGWMLYFFPL